MSIIHDALKKTQINLEKNDPNVNHNVAPATEPVATPTIIKKRPTQEIIVEAPLKQEKNRKEKKPKNLRTLIIIYAIIILALLALSSSVNIEKLMSLAGLNANKKTAQKPATIKATITTQPKIIIKTKNSNLHFNGTMKMDDKIVALINGDVYETGEMVEAYKILDITLKELTIEDKRGELTILRVKSK